MKVGKLTTEQVTALTPPRQSGISDAEVAPYLKELTPVQMGAGLKLTLDSGNAENEAKAAKRGFNSAAKRLGYEIRYKPDKSEANVLYVLRIDPDKIIRRTRRGTGGSNGVATVADSAKVAA